MTLPSSVVRSRLQVRVIRPLLIFLVVSGLATGSFLLGLRSAIQKDRLYFWTKELKIVLYHEYNLVKERMEVRSNRRKKGKAGAIKSFTANDFTLELIHLDDFGHTEKTAGFLTAAQGEVAKYEQANVDEYWTQWQLNEVITDAEPTRFRGGGLKQILQHQGQTLALVSLKGPKDCYFASLINLTQRKEVFRAPCLPPVDELDFSSIGGAWTALGNGLIMSLGTPSDDERVSMLAQDSKSPYGKVLFFSNARLAGEVKDTATFEVHSSGHRNPQGMVQAPNQAVYAVDHGPKGGDEINQLLPGRNYGWPLFSLGSSYQGKPHSPEGDAKRYERPLFAFVPSIAPSDITNCPGPLSQRYAPLSCVLISSLRGQSLFVGLIDATHRVVSMERIEVNMRLREFFHLADGGLAVSTDDYGVFEIVVDEVALRPLRSSEP